MSLTQGLRYDMHAAFRPEAASVLESWVNTHGSTLKSTHGVFRPRYGLFAQAPACGPSNGSGESVIPTFTCNFFAHGPSEARMLMDSVMKELFENAVLKEAFLRTRFEGQFNMLKYEPESARLVRTRDLSAQECALFPGKVADLEYYDSHIHLRGVRNKDHYRRVAALAAAEGMPIIVNVHKSPPHTPFITVRWYNVALSEALRDLERIYRALYPLMTREGVRMKLTPEFEVTVEDPDCQVTDAGWMPTPSTPFTLTGEHCEAPAGFRGEKE